MSRNALVFELPFRTGVVRLVFSKLADVHEDASGIPATLPKNFVLGRVRPRATAHDDGRVVSRLQTGQKLPKAFGELSLGLGTKFSLFAAIESVNPKIVFSINWFVSVAFIGGGVVWWGLERIFTTADESGTNGERKRIPLFWMLLFCLLLVGLTVVGFASALHGTAAPSPRCFRRQRLGSLGIVSMRCPDLAIHPILRGRLR